MLESIEKELAKGLDPKHVSKRRQGGMMVSYIEAIMSSMKRIAYSDMLAGSMMS